uniref:ALK and LTK ligand 1 n=1 Tax=Astyanax mexicanus TaxID=7994 RepID=A0A8B9HWC3_ASTMX
MRCYCVLCLYEWIRCSSAAGVFKHSVYLPFTTQFYLGSPPCRCKVIDIIKLSFSQAGPVKFSSECRTHFHRIYHNTRDCTRPAYYKRCARLLTRLAMSPLCAQP